MLTININKHVEVVLTKEGIDKLQQSEFSDEWRRWVIGGEKFLRIRLQLWKLLAAFGPHQYPGAPPYFVNNNIILIGRVEQ